MHQKVEPLLKTSKLKFILNENYQFTKPVWKNHFFAATVLIILLNIIIHATVASWQRNAFFCPIDRSVWGDTLNFNNLAWSFLIA